MRVDESRSSIDSFLDHLAIERRSSAHTIDAYRRDLQALASWAETQGAGDVISLQAAQLRAFIADEHRRGLTPKSLQRRLSACRSFYQWLLRHGRIAANPASALRAPKAVGSTSFSSPTRDRRSLKLTPTAI